MQGPVIDILLLLLLILFFGRQQSMRPQVHYRYWFAGWVFVFLSYAVWEVKIARPGIRQVQDAVRFDLMLAGLLLFLMSFLAREKRLCRTALEGLTIGLPVVLLINVHRFVPVNAWVMLVGIVAWESCGIYAAYVLVPRGRKKTRMGLFAICGASMVLMPLCLPLLPEIDLGDCALMEVLLCTAVLYGGGLRRRSFTVGVGMAGFVLWAAFYLIYDIFGGVPWLQHLLSQCWIVPKYFVGFSMILKTFEDVAEENEQMAEDFRAVYELHVHPMWIYEAGSGRCLSANAAAVEEYGFAREEFLVMREGELEMPQAPEAEMDARFLPEPSEGRRSRYRCKDGRLVWVNVEDRAIMFQGGVARLVIARDITERLKINQELVRRAHHDPLTGLPNRSLLEDRIQQGMARCGRDGRKAVLLAIDVDYFKRINDTYGHLAGDECLQVVAARLAAKVRQVDTLARVGGEEFAAMIGGVQQRADVEKIAESLLRAFDEPVRLGDKEVPITVSLGIAIYPDDGGDAETLKRRSDEALYAAKHAGRNCAVLASAMDEALRFGAERPAVLTGSSGGDEELGLTAG